MKADAVVVITGASSGIGLECAREFFRQGCRIVMASRSLKELEGIQHELDPEGKRILVIQTDVTKEEECKELIQKAVGKFGRIDVLINNAGITMRALFNDVDIDVLKQLMDVNFWGMVYCTKYALPYLLESKGSIVGMSSVAGYKGLPTRSGYAATKFAMEGFLETLRIENRRTGVHVLIARPGFVATNIRNKMMSANGTMQGVSHKDEAKSMSAAEVSREIFKAVKKRKSYMILSSTAILSFWLNKFFPALVDRLVFKHVFEEKDSPLKNYHTK
ncbi:MAG TPA: SDR family oxidoreductase [Flavobacteriales bacterium]|nr:SDR family oxidoreductase [Flavobacteriales bacterium]HPH82854.1 SDR family oxidoreductase [Flavobacteriales bacterium]